MVALKRAQSPLCGTIRTRIHNTLNKIEVLLESKKGSSSSWQSGSSVTLVK